MKRLFIATSFLIGLGFVSAQSSVAVEPMKDKDLMTWYHKDLSATNVYGINTENAYKYLESKGLKPKTVVVGVLDSGVEVDHPGLAKKYVEKPERSSEQR